MFTGIVEERGRVLDIVALPDEAARIRIQGGVVLSDAGLGDSIAVNGVCLTVAHLDAPGDQDHQADLSHGVFEADVMRETLVRSSLGALAVGDEVNLERAMSAGGRFGGHMMQGHVDGTAVIADRQPSEHWEVVRITLPVDLARYVVSKGSIAVDGVSLTVVETGSDAVGPWFSVSLIPTTLAETTLGEKRIGATVNLEVDVLAKYVERALAYQQGRSEESA